MPTIALLVSSGWGVRSFLQTEVLPRLLVRARVLVLASPLLVEPLRRQLGNAIAVEPLLPFDPRQGAQGRVYERRNAYFERLSATGTRRFREREHRKTLRWRWRDRLRLQRLKMEASLFASPAAMARLAERERSLFFCEYPHVDVYEQLFARLGVALVVSTVPHEPAEAPPVLVARRRGIPVAAWINSWDNLTSKPAYYSEYDRYLVWSERMREEVLRYYPEAGGCPVVATGVPHFDWYRRPEMRWSREELFARLELDPARPLILHAAATPHLAPAEHQIARRLAGEVEAGRLPNRPQLLIRLHPGDAGGRFLDLPRSKSVRLHVPGAPGSGRLAAYCPTPEDNRELVSSVAHADVVVNLASTITLEAALLDRPVVNLAYDPRPGEDLQRLARRFYHL
ncbi:MAG TPA: hypothetical protein VF179_03925, partial [Thermoanaerobaculia bacterium]|nr:hypothetical protein [Thermoanaerobaculia bacterium]